MGRALVRWSAATLLAMYELAELHRFNSWANLRLLAAVGRLGPAQLEERRDGMYNSILGVLSHLAGVELGYLSLMQGQFLEPPSRSIEDVERTLQEAGRGLVELAQSPRLDAGFHTPWFGRDLTIAEGLRQVLTHSTHHRADVNRWLPAFGLESTEINYIDLVLAQ
jgi:uncharacterized damage-inducible protein DinB